MCFSIYSGMNGDVDRRSVVRAIGALTVPVLTGCAGLPTSGESDGSRTRTTVRIDCPPDGLRRPAPERDDDQVAPVEYPSPPEQLDAERARTFATEYEFARLHNLILREETSVRYVDTGISRVRDVRVRRRDDAYLVSFAIRYGYGTDRSDADGVYPVTYLVGPETVGRKAVDDPHDISASDATQTAGCP